MLRFDKILINAGQRGTMLKIAPDDIRRVLAATVAVVAQSCNSLVNPKAETIP
jgi:prolyl-tRNA editing enzyme YbaK/EbsC (Cys-tRNA(Pro) deacylase)